MAWWAAAGVLFGSAYLLPSTVWSIVLAAGAALALCLLYRRQNPTYLTIFVLGVAAHLTVFHWLPSVISVFANSSRLFSLAALLLFAASGSLQFAFVHFIFLGLRRSFLSRLELALPCAWFSAEVLVPKLIPWSLGHTLLAAVPLAQTADLLGAPLLGLLLLWWMGLVLKAWSKLQRQGRDILGAVSLLLLLVATLGAALGYGMLRIAAVEKAAANAPQIRAAIVQGNLDLLTDFLKEKRSLNVQKYRMLSAPLLIKNKPDLLIWPETSVGYDYYEHESFVVRGSPRDPFPGSPIPLIFGGQTRLKKSIDTKPVYHNSIFVYRPDGEIESRYDKQRLFPFSEHIPLSDRIAVLRSLWKKDYVMVPGTSEPLLKISLPKAVPGIPVQIGAAICYEDMFLDPMTSAVSDHGAELLISLSNDAWFLHSVAPLQHHMVASWRAVELKRYFIRVTNNGLTAVIDPLGRTIEKLPRFDAQAMFSDRIRLIREKSVFAVWGRTAAQLLALIFLIWGVVGYRKARQE